MADADLRAFEQLVEQHHGFLRAWLRRLTNGDADLADDLAQDTFLRALRSASGFRGEAQARTWLARIALNVWHDHLRGVSGRSRRAPDSPGHPHEPGTVIDPPRRGIDEHEDEGGGRHGTPSFSLQFDIGPYEHSPSMADRVVNRLDIDRALQRLPQAEREVVIHACWGDLSQSDIAALTGMPLGTVKSLYRRAMKRLQAWLGGAGP